MPAGNPGPVVGGVLALTGAALFGVLLLLWWFLPNPRLAFTPPPDSPGHRFRCRCYEEPVTVIVLASAEEERELVERARRHRRHAKRSRPYRLRR
ncbi:hypothetical protein ACH427_27680 [Streptomyces sp. NPDC020379]|uniref:hypothetical protein n=1 Tax=Streptomyces sp. NPDC020379 TaxID=3365071 RepID=UPI0037A070D1